MDEMSMMDYQSKESNAPSMFVGQIPGDMTEAELKRLFEEFGDVSQLNIMKDDKGKSKGCCFVKYMEYNDALQAQKSLHNNRQLPNMKRPIQMKIADNEAHKESRSLFIGMLNKSVDDTELEAMFAAFGKIESSSILRDNNGHSKACGFVTFTARHSCMNAIKNMHQKITMDGCKTPLIVKFAETRAEKEMKKQATSGQSGLLPLKTTNSSPGLMQNQASFNIPNVPNFGSVSNNSNTPQLQQLLQAALAACTSLQTNPGDSNTLQTLHNLLSVACFTNLMQTSNNSSVASNMSNVANNAMNNLLPHNFNDMSNSSNMFSSGNNSSNMSQDILQQALSGIQQFQQLSMNSSYTNGSMNGMDVINSQNEGPDGSNLFIFHIPKEFNDNDLLNLFKPFGNVISAKVFVDKFTKESKCFGFVSYDSATSANNAITALNGFKIGDKRLKVQLKKAKNDSKPYNRSVMI